MYYYVGLLTQFCSEMLIDTKTISRKKEKQIIQKEKMKKFG